MKAIWNVIVRGIAVIVALAGFLILAGIVGGAESISSFALIKGFMSGIGLMLSGCWIYALTEYAESVRRRNERKMRKYD